MQNDFIDGALGSDEAVSILPAVAEKIAAFDGEISVNSALCRGVTPQSHGNALAAIAACQIKVI